MSIQSIGGEEKKGNAGPRHPEGIRGILGRQARVLTQVGAIFGVHAVARLIAHFCHIENEAGVIALEKGSLWLAVVEFFILETIEFIGAVKRHWRHAMER